MKSFSSLDVCFRSAQLPESQRAAFTAGWYACAIQINEGVDSDFLSADLKEAGFFGPEDESMEP